MPEAGRQGRVPLADYTSGRAAKGYTCNALEAVHIGATGGFKTFRYLDRTGRVWAFYDGTLLYPTALFDNQETGGTHVLDMSDRDRPVETARLITPAMDSPHESLALNPLTGLLAAGMGSPGTAPGIVDIYDVSNDGRHPVLQSCTPLGILGHESGFSPDGRAFWVSTTAQAGVTAIDVSNPRLPSIVWRSTAFTFHGMNLDATGNRPYGADRGTPGLTSLDVSQVQRRVASPVVTEVSRITWPEVNQILSGLRVFDISDPLHPRQAAYFNKPAPNLLPLESGSYAMSAPTFDLAHHQIWFADGDSGFYAVQLTNGAWPRGLSAR